MKWALVLGICSLLFGAAARAQENPKAEVFAGYSYVRMSDSGTANLQGGSASLQLNWKPWLGAVADVGGYDGDGNGLNGTLFTYLFGPKISGHSGKFTPFFQVLFGGAHNTADPPPSVGSLARQREGGVSGGSFGSSNSFAMAAGGGVDFQVKRRLAIRMIQAEYLLTKFYDGLSGHQDNARFSAGVVFTF